MTGLIIAAIVSMIIRMVNNHLIEVTLTIVAAYASYLVAEQLHISGVLAVVAAGLMIGNIGERGMSPTTRISLFNFWELFSYTANSFAFLLIGLVIDLPGPGRQLAADLVCHCGCADRPGRGHLPVLIPIPEYHRQNAARHLLGRPARRHLTGAGTLPARRAWARRPDLCCRI